jgi:hypothetical protein
VPERLDVQVDLVDEKVRFDGRAGANPAVAFDYPPPLVEGKGLTGLQGPGKAAMGGTVYVKGCP